MYIVDFLQKSPFSFEVYRLLSGIITFKSGVNASLIGKRKINAGKVLHVKNSLFLSRLTIVK